MGFSQEEARKFQYVGLTVRGVPLKGGKHKFCCSKDIRIQFYENLLAAYPDFYFNPETCQEIFSQIGCGEDITLNHMLTYCTEVMQMFTEEE